MKCTWEDDVVSCQEEAIEKWIEIPYIDPYCGPFYASADEVPAPHIEYMCTNHSRESRNVFLKSCRHDPVLADSILKRCYDIENL